MDGDLIIGVLMVVFWLLSSLVARFGKAVRKKQPAAQRSDAEPARESPPTPTPAVPLQKMLKDLADQMGLETEASPAEAPVASEHVPTASEHRRAARSTTTTDSEHRVRASEHRMTASEARRTASEQIFELPEHQLTASEHQRGDVAIHRLLVSKPPRRRQSELLRHLHADLTGGKRSLARAMLLREILGPPVGLRSPEP